MSSAVYDKWTRLPDGGCFATDAPGRHSVAGRMGLGTNPQPQSGQTLCSFPSAQPAQKVHSYEQTFV